ncbi:hypothetical protein G6F50_017543 [Rhizopus delemar]|uniref:Uncharacterized protein n=1 Tax=Rhizopus delemar TaxID=936053 RepID=A0A9P6XPW8_9FUNG|nr:hypothetical protein G6F50_017543 [Rhizopus delemar]
MPELTQALKARILAAVNDGYADQTDTLAQLVRITSQRGEEAAAQDFMAAHHLVRQRVQRGRHPPLAHPPGPVADPERPYRRGARGAPVAMGPRPLRSRYHRRLDARTRRG